MFLALFMLSSNVSLASATTLPIAQYQGEHACWSAAASIIAHYFIYANSSTTYCSSYETDIYRNKYPIPYADGLGGTVADIEDGVYLKTNYPGSYSNNPLTYAGIQWQINHDGPVAAGVTMHGGGHALALRGYLANSPSPYIYYTDPYDGLYNRSTYSYLCNSLLYASSAWWQ